jgi:hypothetical protein
MSNTVDFATPTARLPSLDDINSLGPTEMLYFDEEASTWWKEFGVCGHMLWKMQGSTRKPYQVPSVPKPEFLCVANARADGYNCVVEYWRIATARNTWRRAAALDPYSGFMAEDHSGKLYTIQRYMMDRGELFYDSKQYFLNNIESVTLEKHPSRSWDAWNTMISVPGRKFIVMTGLRKFAVMTGLPPNSAAAARDLIVTQRAASMK